MAQSPANPRTIYGKLISNVIVIAILKKLLLASAPPTPAPYKLLLPHCCRYSLLALITCASATDHYCYFMLYASHTLVLNRHHQPQHLIRHRHHHHHGLDSRTTLILHKQQLFEASAHSFSAINDFQQQRHPWGASPSLALSV
eukprot:14733-Heterococcus_DN1.PRE.2